MRRRASWSRYGHALVGTLAVASIEISCGGIRIDDSGYEDQPCYRGTRCHTGLVCISDYCVKPPNVTVDGGKPDAADAAPPTFDAGPAACATSEVFCGGVCVPEGPLHCGAACTRCPAPDGGAARCVNGVCGTRCTGLQCGGACVDPTSDPVNCGGCGNTCAGGQVCSSSLCSCANGGTSCNGACVLTQTDPNNCGTCGHSCPPPMQLCLAGGCVCPPGLLLCGPVCADIATDAFHCGDCTTQCGAGKQCGMGLCFATPALLANNQPSPWAIAVDASNVYWVNNQPGNGSVMQKSMVGIPFTLVANEDSPTTIGIDPGFVYWADNSLSPVARVPIGGGVKVSITVRTARAIAVDANNVYAAMGDGTVTQTPKGGGASQVLASLQDPSLIAVDSTSVYWVPSNASTLERVPIGGGAITTIWTYGAVPNGLAIAGTNAYLAVSDGSIQRVPLNGGVATILATGQSAPTGIAVDATSVYWTNFMPLPRGTVMKVPIGGGATTMLAGNMSAPRGIAVDATKVYWTNVDGGTVMSTPK